MTQSGWAAGAVQHRTKGGTLGGRAGSSGGSTVAEKVECVNLRTSSPTPSARPAGQTGAAEKRRHLKCLKTIVKELQHLPGLGETACLPTWG